MGRRRNQARTGDEPVTLPASPGSPVGYLVEEVARAGFLLRGSTVGPGSECRLRSHGQKWEKPCDTAYE
jgi:hypothetical protein